MSDEPEYLQRMREQKQRKEKSAKPAPAAAGEVPALSKQEKEAVLWAKELGRSDPRSTKNLNGARYAALVKLSSATGASLILEGMKEKDALIERIRTSAHMGEEVVGAYDIAGGRPLNIVVAEGAVTLTPGTVRPAAQKIDPQKMMRLAAAEAARRAKARPASSDRDRFGGGKGGAGGGRGGGHRG